jgi:hypothetical protein
VWRIANEILNFASPEQGAELVGRDLAQRIDSHLSEGDLLGLEAGRPIKDQIHDTALAAAARQEATEPWVCPYRTQGRATGLRRCLEHATDLLEVETLAAEQVEVLGRTVAEVEPGERGSPREKEPLLSLEEGAKQIALQRRQSTRWGGAHRRATLE